MRCERNNRGDTVGFLPRDGSDASSGESFVPSAPEVGGRARVSRAGRWFGRCFYACGHAGLPRTLDCLGHRYLLAKVLKHDFLAATGLYEAEPADGADPRRLIHKMNRRMHFCLLPLGWLGRLVTHSEVCNLRRCEGIHGVPVVLARLSPNSYVYAYVEGQDLGQKPHLPADFFDRLVGVVRQVHVQNLVHLDLHKPGNIIVDDEGRPHVIDFQISTHLGDRFLLSRRLSDRVRRYLQAYDIYHVYKHKRRLQPELLTEAEERLSWNDSVPLRIHRAIARPYRFIRRSVLRSLHASGILTGPDDPRTCAETNPDRWRRK